MPFAIIGFVQKLRGHAQLPERSAHAFLERDGAGRGAAQFAKRRIIERAARRLDVGFGKVARIGDRHAATDRRRNSAVACATSAIKRRSRAASICCIATIVDVSALPWTLIAVAPPVITLPPRAPASAVFGTTIPLRFGTNSSGPFSPTR